MDTAIPDEYWLTTQHQVNKSNILKTKRESSTRFCYGKDGWKRNIRCIICTCKFINIVCSAYNRQANWQQLGLKNFETKYTADYLSCYSQIKKIYRSEGNSKYNIQNIKYLNKNWLSWWTFNIKMYVAVYLILKSEEWLLRRKWKIITSNGYESKNDSKNYPSPDPVSLSL